jgi:hypothetical protein
MKGIRHFLRDFTASAVKEHLRSQIEDLGGPPDLTKNEIELVRFIREDACFAEAPSELPERSPHLATGEVAPAGPLRSVVTERRPFSPRS